MIKLRSILNEIISEQNTSTSKPRVLFVGDSQTAANWSYAKKLLASKRVTGKIVAKNGANTAKVLNMLQSNISKKYDIISIMAGGNDGAAKSPFGAIENFKSMFELVKKYGAKLVVVTNPSKQFVKKGDEYYKKGGYPSNDDISKWLRTQAPADVVINTSNFDNVDFVKDHVHLDSDAHTEIANMWIKDVLDLDLDEPNSAEPDADDIMLVYGDHNNDVKQMQQELIAAGYSVGRAEDDGIFGPDTLAAVKKLQKDADIAVTGKFDSKTKEALSQSEAETPEVSTTAKRKPKRSRMALTSILGTAAGVVSANYDDPVEKQSAALLQQFEGFSSEPYWDVNNWRIGYGSSTVTDASGTVTTLSNDPSETPEYSISKADAARDLERRLSEEFIPNVMKTNGVSSLPAGAIAALVSICYNYGKLPNSVKKAVATKDVTEIADAVYNLSSHNGGINANRRKQEASYILNSK